MLSEEQRGTLIRSARAAVTCKLREIEPALPSTNDESLRARRGVFVSLHAGGELRGCIGVIDPVLSLIETVTGCAVSAATADPRFAPVTFDELVAIRFEISVLSTPHPIAGAADLVIGVHGVIVAGGGRKALLLPQVAPNEGWGPDEFLAAACRKAGLPAAAWRAPAVRLEAFTAEVFGEGS